MHPEAVIGYWELGIEVEVVLKDMTCFER